MTAADTGVLPVLMVDIGTERARAGAAAVLAELPESERRRVAAYGVEADRVRSLVARWALHGLLHRHGVDPGALRRDDRGRLRLPGAGDVSVSHVGRWAAVTWREGGPVGLDLESVARVARLPPGSFTSPGEEARVGGAPARVRDGVRAALWAMKEAAVKATGEGFAAGPRAVQIEWEDARPDRARTRYHDLALSSAVVDGGALALGIAADRPLRPVLEVDAAS